jgi:hypothetical protein
MKKIVFLVAILATLMVTSCTPKQTGVGTNGADSTKVDSCLCDTCTQLTDSVK